MTEDHLRVLVVEIIVRWHVGFALKSLSTATAMETANGIVGHALIKVSSMVGFYCPEFIYSINNKHSL